MSDSAANLLAYAETLRRRLSHEGSLVLEVKVIPRARAAEVSDVMTNGVLKVKVLAAPEKGRANDEVLALLAAFLQVPQRSLELLTGHATSQKRVRVSKA